MRRPRIFDSRRSRSERRVYGAVIAFYAVAVVAMTWPGYLPFSRARPLVLGMPFSLFYLACWVTASFLVLLGLFLWERPRGGEDDV